MPPWWNGHAGELCHQAEARAPARADSAWRTASQKFSVGSAKPLDGSHPRPRANTRIMHDAPEEVGKTNAEKCGAGAYRILPACRDEPQPKLQAARRTISAMAIDITTIRALAMIFCASNVGDRLLEDQRGAPVAASACRQIQRPY